MSPTCVVVCRRPRSTSIRFLVIFASLDLADAAALADDAERARFLVPLRPPSRLRRAATAEIIVEEEKSAEV